MAPATRFHPVRERKITQAKGVVARVLSQFDALAGRPEGPLRGGQVAFILAERKPHPSISLLSEAINAARGRREAE